MPQTDSQIRTEDLPDPEVQDWRRRRTRYTIGLLILGMLSGAPAGFVIGKIAKHHRADVGAADAISLAVATLLLATGLVVLAASLSKSASAFMADPRSPRAERRLRPEQVTYFRLQGLVLALAGGLMATPTLVAVFAPAKLPVLGAPVFAGLVLLFIVQTVFNVQVWRRSDELIRRASQDTAALTFWVLQAGLFLWAAGERLHLFEPLRSWDAYTMVMAVYLLMSGVVASARGLGG